MKDEFLLTNIREMYGNWLRENALRGIYASAKEKDCISVSVFTV